eukprot:5152651-Amphidinium_carterae.1
MLSQGFCSQQSAHFMTDLLIHSAASSGLLQKLIGAWDLAQRLKHICVTSLMFRSHVVESITTTKLFFAHAQETGNSNNVTGAIKLH